MTKGERTMSVIATKKLVLEIDKGVTIGAAMREALIIALTEDIDVEFIHNDTLVSIKPLELLGQLTNELWHLKRQVDDK